MQDRINKLTQLLKPKIEALGYELISLKFQKENKENYLRLVIDKNGNISLDEIVNVSNLISPLLDIYDDIQENYILDVSSLGAEKEIKLNCIDSYLNQYINVHLSHPYKGLNNLIGTLKNVSKETITIEHQVMSKKKLVVLEKKSIDKINLAIKF